MEPEVCTNPECTHDEPNHVYVCPVCQRASLIVRRLVALPAGAVAAYDPLCGLTICT